MDTEAYKKIISRRDGRYDGRIYFGVKTTQIYCRPVCPAQPKPENILIFKSLSEAEKSGYRPCLRCRPDAAPGTKVWEGTGSSVARALRLIEENTSEDLNVEQLAQSLGMSDRHLRRLFDEHLGASPVEIMITQRLHLARQLIEQSTQSFSQIAFAVGFKSIRRFNEAFKELYKESPGAFRKKTTGENDGLELSIPVRAPYDWDMVLAYLKRHEVYGLERVDDTSYTRFISPYDSSDKNYGVLRVSFDKKKNILLLNVRGVKLTELRGLLAKVKNIFDTEHNPKDLPIGKIKPNGVRVPGCFDAYDTMISVIFSQLVSTQQAKNNLKSFVLKFGTLITNTAHGDVYSFPSPARIAKTPAEKLISEIGLTRTKASAIIEVSKQIAEGKIQLSLSSDIQKTRADLLAIKGIGPWTVEMVAMRTLGDSDAFPKKDLFILRAIEAKLAREEDWISSRAYLTHVLWRDFASELTLIGKKKAAKKKANKKTSKKTLSKRKTS